MVLQRPQREEEPEEGAVLSQKTCCPGHDSLSPAPEEFMHSGLSQKNFIDLALRAHMVLSGHVGVHLQSTFDLGNGENVNGWSLLSASLSQ